MYMQNLTGKCVQQGNMKQLLFFKQKKIKNETKKLRPRRE